MTASLPCRVFDVRKGKRWLGGLLSAGEGDEEIADFLLFFPARDTWPTKNRDKTVRRGKARRG